MSIVNNVKVFGLEDSIRASKYPMSPDINICNENITNTVKKIGSCEVGKGIGFGRLRIMRNVTKTVSLI